MLKAILSVLLSFAPWHGDVEEQADRAARLQTIAQAVHVAAEGDKEVAAFLLMTAQKETHLALHVHEGNCRPRECDGGRALGLWQVHRNAFNAPVWEQMKGTSLEATTLQAREAARHYRWAKVTCKTVRGAIASYAIGGRCDWEGAVAREALLEKYRAKL